MSTSALSFATATEVAQAVRSGRSSAKAVVQDALGLIDRGNPAFNAFTAVTAERALARAHWLDQQPPEAGLPLRGVPFAVKNLFDVKGLTTLAGSIIEKDQPPATQDATAVARLEAAGAVLVGALNMDEYAYGFTTENTHYDPTRNPRDGERIAGGSSGGSAASVGAGLVPLSLGTDTNGSIRVPASLSGVFGLKPTFGRLSRHGAYLFASSLDHIGPFARSVADLALSYDVMQGPDPLDPACHARVVQPVSHLLEKGTQGLRIGVLGGYFAENTLPEARLAVERVREALAIDRVVELPEAARARAAAFLVTNAEGANLHLKDLRTRAADFEPLSRDRFLAGALLPASWIVQAQRVRHWYARQVAQVFQDVDVLISAATPCVAPTIGTEWLEIDGKRLPARASMGLLTQPISAIGLPVCVAPLWNVHPKHPGLPLGVQIIAAPWREDLVLRVAAALEAAGVSSAPPAMRGAQ